MAKAQKTVYQKPPMLAPASYFWSALSRRLLPI
jgi:hypothetical protein